jgi:hypothetical protein
MTPKHLKLLFVVALYIAYAPVLYSQETKTLLVLDQSIKSLNGMPYPMGYEITEVGTVNGGGPISISVNSYNPAMGFGANVGVNLGAGLMASAIIDAAMHAEQNKKIASLREPVNNLHLKKLALDLISNKVKGGEQGQIVNYFVPGASDTILKQIQKAEKTTRFGNIYLIKKMQMPVISLSFDNRQLMIVTEVQKNLASTYDSKKVSAYKFAYIGRSLEKTETQNALSYWQDNDYINFLTEINNGFTHIIDFVASNPDISNFQADKKSQTLLNIDGTVFQVPGKLYKITENHAYVIDANEVIHIVHGDVVSEFIPEATP